MTALALAMIVTLLDFTDPADVALWRPVDDVVMGGVSNSDFSQAERGTARFRGNVSLENFGGFASVRTASRDWDAANARAFVLRVRGDGKHYKFTLRTSDRFDGIQYQARFTAPAGEWTDVRLPVDAFVPTFRGRKVPFAPALDPAGVRTLGFTISDRQAGPFELLVDRIAVDRD